jgi:biopolymer transport protein ExbD
MAFKRQRKSRGSEEAAEIPMTPMIDVVFQLLIYFLYTLKPEDVQTHLEVYRPSPEKQQQKSEVPPNLIKIEIFADGYMINEKSLGIDALSNVLQRLAGLDPDQTILIMCSGAAPHDRLVKVLDRCAQAGLKNLSVISTN